MALGWMDRLADGRLEELGMVRGGSEVRDTSLDSPDNKHCVLEFLLAA